MAEHAIRLRVAWEALDPDDADAPPFRVDLPIDWGSFAWPSGKVPRRLRLTRRFGRPAARGAVPPAARLVLGAAAGARSISFNGGPLSWAETAPGRLEADLPPLQPRNVLVVELDPLDPRGATWGDASLVFGPADPVPGPAEPA